MSRSHNGTDQWLSRSDKLGITAYPVSFFAWIKATSVSSFNRSVVGLYQQAPSNNNFLKLAVKTDRTVELAARDSGGYRVATTSNQITLDTWQTVAGVFASTTSRSVYVNGGGKVTDTATDTTSIASLDRFAIGALVEAAVSEFFAGLIGYVGVWDTALSDGNVTSLHGGASPLTVGPPIGFYRLITPGSVTEPDDANNYDLDVNGATLSTDNPPVGSPAAAAAYYAAMLGR